MPAVSTSRVCAAAAVREALSAGMGRGLGDDDFAAVVETVEGLAGIRL